MIQLRTAPTAATQERFQLDFYIEEADWKSMFDRLEVWRSRVGEGGPYEPLHDDGWRPARLPLSSGDPPSVAEAGRAEILVAKTLSFLVGEEREVAVAFTGADPLTLGQAASQITTQSQGLLFSYVWDGELVVQTAQPGAAASLRALGGTAAASLGFEFEELQSIAFGRDARIILKQGQDTYSFVDPNGSSTYWYKARFFNSYTRLVSQFSLPFQGVPAVGLDVRYLVHSYVDVVDMSGDPLCGREVLVHSSDLGHLVSGRLVAGGSQRLTTNKKGRAEVLLVRGSRVSVAIGGTTLVRDLVVPLDVEVTSVNLLSPELGQGDVFAVQRPDLVYATRRSL